MIRRVFLLACAAAWALVPPAQAWNAYGHRMITELALSGLPADAPEWLRAQDLRERVAYQSNEPDRWRGWPADALKHVNDPDHYLDLEMLEPFGLTLESMPALRREYLRALAVSKHVHPERAPEYDASRDPARTKEWPGFLVHAIAEQYAALQSSFNTVRILEEIDEPRRAAQLAQARENAIYHMGILSHFVGDAAQPLHTTVHFNGWTGENPDGFTTSNKFHSYIDGGAIAHHGIRLADLAPRAKFDVSISLRDPWADILAHVRRSHEQMRPLYALERDGKLDGPEGRVLLEARLLDGAQMLSALYWAAYRSAEPTPEQKAKWILYNSFDAEEKMESAPRAAGPQAPAGGGS